MICSSLCIASERFWLSNIKRVAAYMFFDSRYLWVVLRSLEKLKAS